MSSGGSRGAWFQRVRPALARFDARFPIAVKLAIPILIVGIVIGGFAGWTVYRTAATRVRIDFEERALLLTRSIEAGVRNRYLADPEEEMADSLQEYIDALAQVDPSVLLIRAYALQDGTPRVIASTVPSRLGAGEEDLEDAEKDFAAFYAASAIVDEEDLNGQPALEVTLPVRIGGEPAVAIGAYFSTAERDRELAGLVRTFVVGFGGTLFLLLILLAGALKLAVFRRLRLLVAAAGRLEAGDYGARVEGILPPEAKDEILQLSLRFNTMAEAIQTLHRRLQEQARTDELTGLYNRRYLLEVLEREIARARRRREPLAAIMLDLDGLKTVNDRSGHPAGDAVLRQVAEALQSTLRAGDVAARFGGDEFVALLPDCDTQRLTSLMERVRRAAEGLGVVHLGGGKTMPITVSVGGAVLRPGDDTDTLLQRADTALLEAKRAGRNQVRVAA